MTHKVELVKDLMYKGCELHWHCVRCDEYIPVHCYSKEELEKMECKKMTYEEIIKGLTELSLYTGFQEKHIQVLKASIDLIKCQKTETERLQKEVNLVSILFQDLQERTNEVKDEAYKEFAERLKNKWFDERYDSPDVDFDDFIDNLLKDMVGEQ